MLPSNGFGFICSVLLFCSGLRRRVFMSFGGDFSPSFPTLFPGDQGLSSLYSARFGFGKKYCLFPIELKIESNRFCCCCCTKLCITIKSCTTRWNRSCRIFGSITSTFGLFSRSASDDASDRAVKGYNRSKRSIDFMKLCLCLFLSLFPLPRTPKRMLNRMDAAFPWFMYSFIHCLCRAQDAAVWPRRSFNHSSLMP